MPFGTAGDIHSQAGSAEWYASLPPWLQAQVRQVQYNTGGDGGQMESRWVAGNSGEFGSGSEDQGGYIRDEQGHPVYQLGNWDGSGVGNGGFTVTDPKQIHHDAVLGDVVDPSYVHSVKKLGPNYAMIAAVLGMGALGTVAGLGAEAAGGAGYGTMTGVAGDESAGLLGTGSYGGGAAGGAAGGSGGGLLGGGGSGLTPLEGVTLGPEASFTPMDSMASQPWYQQAMQSAMNNPMNTARTGLGLYSMLTANQGNVGGNAGGFAGGEVAGGPIPQLDLLKAAGQFQQNPYLAAQMFNVPFMGSSYHGMGL
jgi:hypothetical protein